MNNLFFFSTKYFKKYRIRFGMGFLLIIISNILTLFPIPYVGKSINIINKLFNNVSNINYSEFEHDIIIYTCIILIIPILSGIVKYYMRQCMITTSRMIEFDIKNDIFSHYQKLNISFYKKHSTGDLMNRLTEDVSFIRQYIGPGLMYLLNVITLVIMVFFKMFFINRYLTYHVMLPVPFLIIFIYFISKLISKNSENVQKYQSVICSFIQETFSGIHIIKSFVSENIFYNRYRNIVTIYKKKYIHLFKSDSFLSSIILLLIGIIHVFILFFGGNKYYNGEIKEIGTIAEFFTYINVLIFPIFILSWVVSIIEKAKISQSRIEEFLKINPKIYCINCNSFIKKREIFGKIEFKNVSFSYDSTYYKNIKYSINNVSFIVNSGKNLVITGEVGSGKTTLGYLISRLYDPNKGIIMIDDYPLNKYNLNEIRKYIGYIPQYSFIFSDSIYNNIALGSKNEFIPTYQEVYKASKIAMIEEDILKFKYGYNTMIGNKGISLSGGQKQRICIARSILRKPKIIIFDDGFSSIDEPTSRSILENIKNILIDSTIIIIVNDLPSYITDFDIKIVLKNGIISKIYKK